MRQITLVCTCGGSTTVNVEKGADTAAAECACGKILLWSEGETKSEPPATHPPTLGISTGDAVKTSEKLN